MADRLSNLPAGRPAQWAFGIDLEFALDAAEIAAFKSEVNSSLNVNPPIRIELGNDEPLFSVRKRGPGGPALGQGEQDRNLYREAH